MVDEGGDTSLRFLVNETIELYARQGSEAGIKPEAEAGAEPGQTFVEDRVRRHLMPQGPGAFKIFLEEDMPSLASV